MGADGAICNHMARLALRLVIPAGRGGPAPTHCAPSNSSGTTAITEGETGSPEPVLPERLSTPRAPQYLSASLGHAILESTMETEKFGTGFTT